jgi:Reverse transcriptase (RNA-dependent DNA polymerase)
VESGRVQTDPNDYTYTYSPNASWPAIRLQLVLTLLNGWHTKQIDYVQAFPQAPIEVIQHAALPKGISIEGIGNPDDWCLKVHKNVYGGKSAGRQWYLHLKSKLEGIGFVRSQFDECVFYKGKCIYVLYTDDSILSGPDEEELESTVREIEASGLGITNEGDISDFLGVNIAKVGGEYHLTQPWLIQSILDELHLDQSSTTKDILPMKSPKLLSRHRTPSRSIVTSTIDGYSVN